MRSPADQSPTTMKLQYREGKIMRFKDKRITLEPQTELSVAPEAEMSTKPSYVTSPEPEPDKYGIGCIICGELAATASYPSGLPKFAICDNCRKAIIKLRKMLEE